MSPALLRRLHVAMLKPFPDTVEGFEKQVQAMAVVLDAAVEERLDALAEHARTHPLRSLAMLLESRPKP